MLLVPLTGLEVRGEAGDDPLFDLRLDQLPDRLRGAHRRIEDRLGTIPEGLEEAVGAIGRRRDRLDPGGAPELGGDLPGRAEARTARAPAPDEVVELPRDQRVELEGEDDDRTAGDAAQLGEPGRAIPVVDRHAGHRRVDRVVVEGQRLGHARQARRERPAGAAPASSRSARPPAPSDPRLIGARPRPDIKDGPRVPQRHKDRGRDPRIRPPPPGISDAMRLVVHRGHPRTVPRGRDRDDPPRTLKAREARLVRGGSSRSLPRRSRSPSVHLPRREISRTEPAVSHEGGGGDKA